MTTSRPIPACSRNFGVSITRPAESSSVSKALPYSSRRSSRPCWDSGFGTCCRACSAMSVYVFAGYSETQLSIALDKNTPLLRSARNLDGMVSRFLASRLCSKVPVKAKAHVGSRSGRGGQSIPGGGVGGAPPPGNGFARGKVPHFVPLCNTETALRPTSAQICPIAHVEMAALQGFHRGTVFVQNARRPAGHGAALGSARRLAVCAVLPGPRGRKWEELASACRERGDQRRGHEQ